MKALKLDFLYCRPARAAAGLQCERCDTAHGGGQLQPGLRRRARPALLRPSLFLQDKPTCHKQDLPVPSLQFARPASTPSRMGSLSILFRLSCILVEYPLFKCLLHRLGV